MSLGLTPDERKAIRAMKRLEKAWPTTLWIFATGGPLTILKLGEDGERVVNHLDAMDPDRTVATINIPNDGGDW